MHRDTPPSPLDGDGGDVAPSAAGLRLCHPWVPWGVQEALADEQDRVYRMGRCCKSCPVQGAGAARLDMAWGGGPSVCPLSLVKLLVGLLVRGCAGTRLC